MANLITSSNNTPTPTNVALNHASQPSKAMAHTNQVNTNTTTENSGLKQVQWAKLESSISLNTQQKVQLTELNPSLAKTLVGQIKGDPQGASNALSPQNISLLKQSPLQLLALKLDNTTIHIVTPSNLTAVLGANANTNTQLPIVPTQNGWHIATTNQLKTALQTAAAQLLKQNLPLQTSSIPLFKVAHTLNSNKSTVLAHLPKTQAHIQTLAAQTIDSIKIKNPQVLGHELVKTLKANTTVNQVANIQQNLNRELLLENNNNALNTKQTLTQLEKSLHQLQSAIATNIPTAHKNILMTLSTLQTNVQTMLSSKQNLNSMQLSHVNQISKALTTLVENAQKSSAQDNIANIIGQQVNTFIKPINNMSNASSAPANNAIMQLLGVALHAQQLDQDILQKKVHQQLKTLIEQVSAKLQINQLRHLGLDSSREATPFIQQLQGEVPLRFNEQILPLTYHIQGFDEKAPEQQNDEQTSKTKEKVRRWQVFMSLDLPHNETLHCKLSLVDNHISTTLWAESAQLCQRTQSLIGDLEQRFVQAGLTVETLQCFAGMPPQDETSLNYNLVDVTT